MKNTHRMSDHRRAVTPLTSLTTLAAGPDGWAARCRGDLAVLRAPDSRRGCAGNCGGAAASLSCRLSGQRLRRSRLCCCAARGFRGPITTLGHVGLVRTLACWKLRLRSACIVRIVSAATLVVVGVITLLIGGIAKLPVWL